MTQSVVCIHHANCLDGIGAAWVVWDHYKRQGIDIELIPANYQKGLPEGLEGKKVYVVDFSYDYATTEWLIKNTDLVLLDHHETAIRRLQNLTMNLSLEAVTLPGKDVSSSLIKAMKAGYPDITLDGEYSGAMLAWRHFHPNEEAPAGIQFAQDRDLWRWKLNGTRMWTTTAFSYPFTVEAFHELLQRPVDDVVREGEALRRKYEKDLNIIAQSVRGMDFMGYKVPVINANHFYASELGDSMSTYNPFVVIYSDGTSGRNFSLRSDKEYGINVAAIAELFGGGGHVNAAGFVLPYTDRRINTSHKKLDITFKQKVKRLFGKL